MSNPRVLQRYEALPCPFCGLRPEIQKWHGGGPQKRLVSCGFDGCSAQPSVFGSTPKRALINWNTRGGMLMNPMTNENERAAFEKWYVDTAFDYCKDQIGSRDCSLQWEAWQSSRAQLIARQEKAEVVAWGRWHVKDKRLGCFTYSTEESANYEKSAGYVVVPLCISERSEKRSNRTSTLLYAQPSKKKAKSHE